MRKTLLCFVVLIASSLRGDILLPIFFQQNGPSITPWTIRNKQSVFFNGPSTSAPMPAFPNALTNGSIILLGTQNFTVSSTIITITDTAGNTYNSLRHNQWTNGTASYFCATNTHTTTGNVITFAAANVQFLTMDAVEITSTTGALTCASNLDVMQGNSTSSTPSTTILAANLTTTANADFVWGQFFVGGASSLSPGPGFATIIQNGSADLSEFEVQQLSGLISVTAINTITGIGFDAFGLAVKHP